MRKRGPVPVSPEVRFWKHVDRSGKCWLWTGRINKDGYGVFGVSGSEWALAHRFAWTLRRGKIADGKKILHRCTARNCVRHTYEGTNKDNTRDMMKAGNGRWTGAGTRKLDAGQKNSIRQGLAIGRSTHSLAKQYGVSVSTIRFYRDKASRNLLERR